MIISQISEFVKDELRKEEIARLINKEEPLIVEIGAYDGKDSAELYNLYGGNCQIHCFEADPRSFQLLQRRNVYKAKEGFHLWNIALTKADGDVTLYQSDSKTRRHFHNLHSWSASSSLREAKAHLELFPDVEFNRSIEVEGRSLDSMFFVEEIFFPREVIDFVWCDVNGAEQDVLLGGLHVLNNYTRFLYIEFSNKELYKGQVGKEELLKLLPNFEELGVYNFQGNFGNVLLKNKTL